MRTLSDEQYSDIIAVCKKFPQVTIKAQSQGWYDVGLKLLYRVVTSDKHYIEW